MSWNILFFFWTAFLNQYLQNPTLIIVFIFSLFFGENVGCKKVVLLKSKAIYSRSSDFTFKSIIFGLLLSKSLPLFYLYLTFNLLSFYIVLPSPTFRFSSTYLQFTFNFYNHNFLVKSGLYILGKCCPIPGRTILDFGEAIRRDLGRS